MENNIFKRLNRLHSKTIDIVKHCQIFPEKDIKRNYVELISSQVATSLITLKIVFDCFENQNEKFSSLLKNDSDLIENYIHSFKQSLIESILDTIIFQGELVLRVLNGKLTDENPSKEKNINRIIANLYVDVENNWTKNETKILILLWTMRNTIHTGGIYFNNKNGFLLEYKEQTFRFEYGKSFTFLADNHIIDLISDYLDSIITLFKSDKIIALGEIEHPSHFALKE